jgi:CubicO group peptidase (beta-lactamase class C family)
VSVDVVQCEGDAYVAEKSELTLIVGVTQNGQRAYFPFRSPDAKYAPMPDEKTLYEIGSFSKLFTTSLLSILVSRGVLSLDDTVGRYFPQLNLKPEIAQITVFDLATHSSGLSGNGIVMDRMINEAVASGDFANYTYYERYGVAELHAELEVAELVRPPRSGWEYSRTGMTTLSHILELATGADWESLVKEHICGPLGLADTAYTLSDEQDSRLVRGYYKDGTPSQLWYWGVGIGQGGLRSTMDDMLTFLEANLAEDDSQLTRDLTFARNTEFAWPEGYSLPEVPGVIPPPFNLGLGWMNVRTPTGIISQHLGGTFSYQSYGGVQQESKTGVAVLTSSANNIADLETFPGWAVTLMRKVLAQ